MIKIVSKQEYKTNSPFSMQQTKQVKNWLYTDLYKDSKHSLSQDFVSFGHSKNTQLVKKSDFSEADFVVVEKFRVDISGFKKPSDLQDWALNKIKTDFLNKDFDGHKQKTKAERKIELQDWFEKVTKENKYQPTIQLLILEAVTKDLKKSNDDLPPILKKSILDETVNEYIEKAKEDPKEGTKLSLGKMYKTKLLSTYSKVSDRTTGWIVLPSSEHDPEHFYENLEKLRFLSNRSWCTKNSENGHYLNLGDFHIYLENGQPKLGIGFLGDYANEIEGELNNKNIPQKYLNELKKHIKEDNLKLTIKAKTSIKEADLSKIKIDKIKKDLNESIKKNDAKTIFSYFKMEPQEDKNGYLTLSYYQQPGILFSFEDLGIDEAKLFAKVKKIEGNADFYNSALTNLNELDFIGGDAFFSGSKVSSLGKLKQIKGDADFMGSKVKSLNELTFIGGSAYFRDSDIEDLGELRIIVESADFCQSKIKDFGKLEKIGGLIYYDSEDLEKCFKKRVNLKNRLLRKMYNFVKIFHPVELDKIPF